MSNWIKEKVDHGVEPSIYLGVLKSEMLTIGGIGLPVLAIDRKYMGDRSFPAPFFYVDGTGATSEDVMACIEEKIRIETGRIDAEIGDREASRFVFTVLEPIVYLDDASLSIHTSFYGFGTYGLMALVDEHP